MTLLCSTGKGAMRLLDGVSLCNPGSRFRLEKKPALAAFFATSAGFTSGQLHCPNDRRNRAGLEVQLQADLVPAGISNKRRWVTGVGVSFVAGVLAAPVVVIGGVENVECKTIRCRRPPEVWEVLTESDVDVLIRE